MVLDEYALALDQAEGRLEKLLHVALHADCRCEPYPEPVSWLRWFRGIDTVTAIMVLAESHRLPRASGRCAP